MQRPGCRKKGVTHDMHPKMSKQTKDEVMEKLRGRYARAGQKHKTKLIDQAIDLFDYHRKAAIRALRHTPRAPQAPAFIGRPLKYEPAVLLPPLKVIWLASQQPCGKLLAAALPDWVPARKKTDFSAESVSSVLP